MILYYAMGGGLGHLTRSLAILQELPQLTAQIRLLASSQHAALVIPSAPCPVDVVTGDILTSRRKYLRFLEEYLKTYQISSIILDTFPFGIVGEWLHIGCTLPRFLIARYLKWNAYQERIGHHDGPLPQHTLVLEPLSQQYVRRLKRDSQLVRLDAPITLQAGEATHRSQLVKKGCLIIHSGNEVECKKLLQVAQKRMSENDDVFSVPDCIFPEQGIYPAERMIPRYKTIISAAGYNMVALASQAPPDQTHILHPFTRRFDNQFLRLRRFKQGLWSQQQANGTQQAARWLSSIIMRGGCG